MKIELPVFIKKEPQGYVLGVLMKSGVHALDDVGGPYETVAAAKLGIRRLLYKSMTMLALDNMTTQRAERARKTIQNAKANAHYLRNTPAAVRPAADPGKRLKAYQRMKRRGKR